MNKKRFIISLDPSSAAQKLAFIDFLNASNYNWWHWLNDTFLVVDNSGRSIDVLTTRVQNIFPNINFLINEVENTYWEGKGPSDNNDAKKNMFHWLHSVWLD